MSHRLLRAAVDLLPPPNGRPLDVALRHRWLHLVEVALDAIYANGHLDTDDRADEPAHFVDELLDAGRGTVQEPVNSDDARAALNPTDDERRYPCPNPGCSYVGATPGALGGHRAGCNRRLAVARAAARKGAASLPQAPPASSLAVFACPPLEDPEEDVKPDGGILVTDADLPPLVDLTAPPRQRWTCTACGGNYSAAYTRDAHAVFCSPIEVAGKRILPSTGECAAEEDHARLRARLGAGKATSLGHRRADTNGVAARQAAAADPVYRTKHRRS